MINDVGLITRSGFIHSPECDQRSPDHVSLTLLLRLAIKYSIPGTPYHILSPLSQRRIPSFAALLISPKYILCVLILEFSPAPIVCRRVRIVNLLIP